MKEFSKVAISVGVGCIFTGIVYDKLGNDKKVMEKLLKACLSLI